MRTRILILVLTVGLALVAAVPALAKGGGPNTTPTPTISLVLTCHWEAGGEIPFAHLDATVNWSGLSKRRHSLGIEVVDLDDPYSGGGHGHSLFQQPVGTYFHHMDLGITAGGHYGGSAYIIGKRGERVAQAVAEASC